MKNTENTVSREEAMEQVRVIGTRLALMHLAFSRVLIDALGEEKGKEAIVRAMMDYGRMAGERSRAGGQDLPHYGLHRKYEYDGRTFQDMRERPAEGFNHDLYKVYGCILAEVFKEMGERDLGRLYCFVDAAKSMAADPSRKLIHTACELCGDDHCAFDLPETDPDERADFQNLNPRWKRVDPILLKDGE